MLDDLLKATWHRTERYANNRVEADHGRLKARLGPMRGLKEERRTSIVIELGLAAPATALSGGVGVLLRPGMLVLKWRY